MVWLGPPLQGSEQKPEVDPGYGLDVRWGGKEEKFDLSMKWMDAEQPGRAGGGGGE